MRLTPKSLAVLWLLAERAGLVVTKDELFATVWTETAVTDAALASCIQEIRHALEDDARQPRFIETIHRRGYRFVASISIGDDNSGTGPERDPFGRGGAPLVGREAEISAVLAAFSAAGHGTRQICLVSGEPGVGKSAVLGESLVEINRSGAIVTTWAHCVEHHGSGEPYQPLLDALMRLCRQPGGGRALTILERFAPTWLAQLPGLLPVRTFSALQQRMAGVSRDRMLRELTNAVEALAERDPFILCIEDLHWSDPSTLDWIGTVAPRTDPAKLLILATMRPSAHDDADRPLTFLRDTLRARRLAREIPLRGLDGASVARYVAVKFPPAPGRAEGLNRLARRLGRHTGGNPLFMATLLEQLVERGVVFADRAGWAVSEDVETLDLGFPDSVRPVIERQVEALPEASRRLLEVASVVGETFPVAVIAGTASLDAGQVEATLSTSASRRFVRSAGSVPLPDGAVSTQLAFVHTLFRDALYEGIEPDRRTDLHRRVGGFEERMWGPRAQGIAAELAVHFERGRDLPRAIRYLQQAAENARRRSAFREARLHYERALSLLERRPDDGDRVERELNLQMGLGAAIMATSGFGAPEVEGAYSRARNLCHRVGDVPRLFPTLWGLWLFYWGRGALRTAEELARELRDLAAIGDAGMRLQALHASWATAFSLGRLSLACEDALTAADLYHRESHAPMAATYGSHDASVCALMFTGRAQALMGRVDDSIRTGDEAIRVAKSLDHPFSTALSLTFRAAAAQSCNDAVAAGTYATEAGALAREQGFGLLLAWCTTIGGWAAARRGEAADGLASIGQGIAATRRSGSDQFLPYLLSLRADACLAAGTHDEGVAAVREGLAVVERTGECFYEAELHRLNGDLILAGRVDAPAAKAEYEAAFKIARRQGAWLLALRAAIRLARLPSGSTESVRARALVRASRAAIPEGSLTDAAEADALLAD